MTKAAGTQEKKPLISTRLAALIVVCLVVIVAVVVHFGHGARPRIPVPVHQAASTQVGADAGPSVVLAFVGDVLPVGLSYPINGGPLSSADIAFCNLECPLSNRGVRTPLKYHDGRLLSNEFIFRASPNTAKYLSRTGIDVVSLANNHMMDYGPTALADTISVLDNHHIAHVGAGKDITSARECTVIQRNGLRVAFLSYLLDNTLPGTKYFAASTTDPGVVMLHEGSSKRADPNAERIISDDIASARREADVVVVSFHWGIERQSCPTESQRQLAHSTIDHGADIVVGHHPHCLQGIEFYKHKPIIYSLGNFVFYGRSELTRESGIVWVKVNKKNVEEMGFSGAWIEGMQPTFSGGAGTMTAAHTMCDLSKDLGTVAQLVMQNGYPQAIISIDGKQASPMTAVNQKVSPDDLVEVTKVAPDVVVDLRYAGTHNAFHTRMYDSQRCYLRRATALKLKSASAILSKSGLRLKLWDGYRPISVQRKMWKMEPDARFVADPKKGSNHNRGAAVDITLVDRNGRELRMPTDFDDFTSQARADYSGPSAEVRKNVRLLQSAMTSAGFHRLSTEWWHFDDLEAWKYWISDTPPH